MRNYYPSLILQLLLLGLPPCIFAQLTIPSCAVTCYNDGVTISGCAKDDLACQCGPASETAAVQDSLTTCLTASCSITDIYNYNTWALGICTDVIASSYLGILSSLTSTLPTVTSARGTVRTSAITVPTVVTTTRAGSVATITTTPLAASSTSTPKEKKVSLGVIIGCVVGGLIVAGLLIIGIIFCCWRRSKSRAAKRAQQAQQQQQVQPLMTQQNQLNSTQSPMPYQVSPMSVKVQPAMIPTPPPIPPLYIGTTPEKQYNSPTAHTVEIEGEWRKSFVEIEGMEMATNGQPHRPAELSSNNDMGLGGNPNIPR